MLALRVIVPEGLSFEALQLARKPTGIVFDWAPIERICEHSSIDIDLLREQDESNVTGLIVEWYAIHLKLGGATDPVMEQLLAEAEAEGDRDPASVMPSAGRVQ